MVASGTTLVAGCGAAPSSGTATGTRRRVATASTGPLATTGPTGYAFACAQGVVASAAPVGTSNERKGAREEREVKNKQRPERASPW